MSRARFHQSQIRGSCQKTWGSPHCSLGQILGTNWDLGNWIGTQKDIPGRRTSTCKGTGQGFEFVGRAAWSTCTDKLASSGEPQG